MQFKQVAGIKINETKFKSVECDVIKLRLDVVTSTNFSFLNFGKFLKFCSDDKKFFEIL